MINDYKADLSNFEFTVVGYRLVISNIQADIKNIDYGKGGNLSLTVSNPHASAKYMKVVYTSTSQSNNVIDIDLT